MNYNSLVRMREEQVAGIGPWLWIESDTGAWDGPKDDWETSHVHVIEQHVTDRRTCVQAGGNQGMYPRLLSYMFSNVYTFEPDPLNFYCLTFNCQEDNIFKMQAALGAETGMARVNRITMHNTGCHTVATDGECYTPMLTIDSLNLPHCGYFQLDIECYEIAALQGAVETIARCKPVIQCENGNENITNFLSEFGYEVVGTSKADTIYKYTK